MWATFHSRLWIWLLCCAAIPGCAENQKAPIKNDPSPQFDPQQIQSQTMNFAERYMIVMANVYGQVRDSSKTPEGKIMAQRYMVDGGIGAMGNATNPNPLLGMMDMAVMVTLSRVIAETQSSQELFGADSATVIVSTLRMEESEIWHLLEPYLSKAQVSELKELANEWRQKHPDQRFVTGARIVDTLDTKSPGGSDPRQSDVLGLIHIDPLVNLDPAVREVKQSRILVERAFFYVQHMPLLLVWQADMLYLQMLDDPQIRRVVENSTSVANSAAHFNESAGKVADAGNHLSEVFRQLPQKWKDLLNQIVKESHETAQQTTAQISELLDHQQETLIRHEQGVIDHSIDRAYGRLRSLIIIAAASIFGAMVVYRTIAVTVLRTRSRR
jgi:hypothetical protein